jgi:hypothetical protein
MALELEELRKELEGRLRDFGKKIEGAWEAYSAKDFGYALHYLVEDVEDRVRKYTGGRVECHPSMDVERNRLVIAVHCIARRPGERTVVEAEATYATARDFSRIKLEDVYIYTSRAEHAL